MKRRILSLILAIVMVVGMLPTVALAAEDTATAEITGVALIVDGTEYSSGLVTLTAANTVRTEGLRHQSAVRYG